jgi:site-specific recombinase XerD
VKLRRWALVGRRTAVVFILQSYTLIVCSVNGAQTCAGGDIERYVVKRLQDVAPATVNRELSFLRRVFNVAIPDDTAERNPVRGVRFLKENNRRVRFLTDGEEAALRKEPQRRPLVLRARRAAHGAPSRRTVRLALGACRFRERHPDRRVPMNAIVRDTLRALPSRMKNAYVFPSATGVTPLDAVNFVERVFAPAVKRARIANFHWHDLRHTFASRLTMAVVDLRTVQELMGHTTVVMTLRYSHLSPQHQQDAVERLTTRTPTVTRTATSDSSAGELKEGPAKVPDSPGEKRAGDRGRTGDVQLGKLAFYR